MKKALLTTALCTLSVGVPAHADPTFGGGFTIVFGSGGFDTGFGLRVFSDDEEDEFAASLGVDYLFGSGQFRPTVGGAYLFDGAYLGADLGLNLTGGGIDFSLGLGGADTQDPAAAPPVLLFSDSRLKTDIAKLGVLESGVAIYRFRYKSVSRFRGVLDTETVFVGVMAQDLLKTHPEAVTRAADGYYRVDYSKIGFDMVTLALWESRRLTPANRVVMAAAL